MLSRSMRVSPGIRAAAVLWGVAVLCGLTAAAAHQGGAALKILSGCLSFAFAVCTLVHLWLSRRLGEKYRSSVAGNVLSGYASLCIGLSLAFCWGQPGPVSKMLIVVQVLVFGLAAQSLWSAMRTIVRSR